MRMHVHVHMHMRRTCTCARLPPQVPALLCAGVTVVITPLVSLLKDQLLHLAEAAVDAAAFTGAQEWEAQRDTYDSLRAEPPGLRILFLTPEKVRRGAAAGVPCPVCAHGET